MPKSGAKEIKNSFSIPEWSPLYHEPPHHFRGVTKLSVLCRAPGGVIKSLLPKPLKFREDLFVLAWDQVDDVEGYNNMHFNSITFPCAWKDNLGGHCAIEYIDSDMGLTIGRDVWGYPKKGASFLWNETANDLKVECHRGGVLLMRTAFSPSHSTRPSTPEVEWPDTTYHYQIRRVPPAARTLSAQVQVIRCEFSELVTHSSVKGSAQVNFFDGPRDPLKHLGPVDVLDASLEHLDFVFDYGEVVETLK
jgi:acetoacetate decarboxylase